MTNNDKLLESIYKNAATARDVLRKMIKYCNDGNMRESMADQFAAYHAVLETAKSHMTYDETENATPKKCFRTRLYSALKFNLRIDKTSSHMAEMLILGSTLGIIDLTRDINEYESAEDEVKSLAVRLIMVEEAALKAMRRFL